MNSLERVVAALSGQAVDRTPVAPVLLQQGARMLGVPLREYFGDPRRLAEGQERLLERFQHDVVFAFPHVVQDTLPFQVELTFHDEGPPSVRKMALQRYEELEHWKVPDPTRHPYLQRTLQAATALARRFKGTVPILGAVIGPFSLPTLLMGTGKFLDLLLRWPDLRKRWYPKLVDIMVEYTSRWAQAQLDAGCDLVVVAEGISSASLLTEATFVAEALPLIRRWSSQVRGLKALELVGDSQPFAPHLAQLDVAAVLIGGNDDPARMRKALGASKGLIGNLNNLKLMRWDPERVEFEARRVIRAAGPGFVLGNQGPELPWHVPDANIDALVRAARARRAVVTS